MNEYGVVLKIMIVANSSTGQRIFLKFSKCGLEKTGDVELPQRKKY